MPANEPVFPLETETMTAHLSFFPVGNGDMTLVQTDFDRIEYSGRRGQSR